MSVQLSPIIDTMSCMFVLPMLWTPYSSRETCAHSHMYTLNCPTHFPKYHIQCHVYNPCILNSFFEMF